jgi:hypothetical protein
MARDILDEYGPDAHKPQAGRASTGGVKSAHDVHAYKPPMGPTSINSPQSPGLHGDNYGHTNGPDRSSRESGKVGLRGEVHHCGSQGRH